MTFRTASGDPYEGARGRDKAVLASAAAIRSTIPESDWKRAHLRILAEADLVAKRLAAAPPTQPQQVNAGRTMAEWRADQARRKTANADKRKRTLAEYRAERTAGKLLRAAEKQAKREARALAKASAPPKRTWAEYRAEQIATAAVKAAAKKARDAEKIAARHRKEEQQREKRRARRAAKLGGLDIAA